MGNIRAECLGMHSPHLISAELQEVFLNDSRMGQVFELDQKEKHKLFEELQDHQYAQGQTYKKIWQSSGEERAGYLYRPREFFYEGGIGPDGAMQGKGRITLLSSLHHYCGSFHNNQASGIGVMQLYKKSQDSGSKVQVIQGNWEDGTVQGITFKDKAGKNVAFQKKAVEPIIVSIKFPDKSRYEGQVKDRYGSQSGPERCIVEGRGQLFYEDGSSVKGHFQKGVLNGKGQYCNAQNQLIYEGNFKDGKFHGLGTFFDPQKNARLDINWIDNKPDGEGQAVIGQEKIHVFYENGVRINRVRSTIDPN